jgi:glycosyltransferase involved in cell wall biosynthesis
MRVALVSEHASPLTALGGVDAGGQNVHVAQLALALGRRGVEVVVHTRRDDRALPDRVALGPNVVVHHVDAGPPRVLPKDDLLPFMGRFAVELRSAWRRSRPQIVHSHFWMSGYAALQAAGPLGLPVVHTFHALGVVKRRHQGASDTSPAARLPLEERIVREADRIVATCSDEVFELLRLGADRRRISVVPCGVDPEAFRPDGPRASRSPTLQRILSVSRLVERKGVGNVISAMPSLPGAELLIAGGTDDDPYLHRLEEHARRLGVGDRVRFLGSVARPALPPLMRSSDVIACVPWYEPFGIVPVEAMACGVPVVATAVGGMIDTVVHDVTGLHVPPRDVEAIAAALAALLGDEPRRRRLGAAGAERARRRYCWARVGDATLEAYAAVLEQRHDTRRLGARA